MMLEVPVGSADILKIVGLVFFGIFGLYGCTEGTGEGGLIIYLATYTAGCFYFP